MTRIALLNIGSELLRGRTVNTNASQIGLMLGSQGFALDTTWVIHDEEEAITSAVVDLMNRHEVVLITGGLGPTTDDITKKTLLKIFGGEMVCHEATLERIRTFLSRRNMPLLENNRQQSFVPSTCTVIENEMGTAPGMVFKKDGKLIVSMPGVPFEMEHLMRKGVLPELKNEFLKAHLATSVVRTHGIPESRIADRMEKIVADFDVRIMVAYLPSFDGTKIELKIQGPPSQADELDATVKNAQKAVAKELRDYVYSLEDLPPVEILCRHLLNQNMGLATAESCTGGAISAKIVEQSGVSAVFMGGVVAYHEQIKSGWLGVSSELIKQHGVVSAGVAEAMASGVRERMKTAIGLSITGMVEANGDNQTGAWIGFSDSSGNHSCQIKLFKDRKINIQYATQAALVFAVRMLCPLSLD